MTSPSSNDTPPYRNSDSAPFVYFDIAPTYGVMNGAVQIELAARTLSPAGDGGVTTEFVAVARLRCSPTAATILRDAINKALDSLIQPNPAPAAVSGPLN